MTRRDWLTAIGNAALTGIFIGGMLTGLFLLALQGIRRAGRNTALPREPL